MAARRRRKKRRSYSQEVLLLLTGSALTLCALSIVYGFLIRQSMAEHKIREIRVEVLNGTGEKGLARRAAVALMRRGVDVLQVDNADNFSYEESILIGRRKNEDLRALGDALGCRNVIEQFKDDSFVDATLILGADYRTLNLGDLADSRLRE